MTITLLRKMILPLATFLSVSAHAQTAIDPISQTYYVLEADVVGASMLQRTYSSTTTFRGVFGLGWCSELDARIEFYAEGEERFRSCDLSNARSIDRRLEAAVSKTDTGYRRLREDGAIQFFARSGVLQKIVRGSIEIQFHRDARSRLEEITVKDRRHEMTVTVLMGETIQAIGATRYEYQNGLLIAAGATRFRYDDMLNMTTRLSRGVSETIHYDSDSDRVLQVTRRTAKGRERIAIESRETGIEIQAKLERGAETRPVRILYDTRTQALSVEGDADTARWLLAQVRS